MEKLPSEILSCIVTYLLEKKHAVGLPSYDPNPENPMAAYATISRSWQAAVEPVLFRQLYLTERKLATAETYNYLTANRLAYVRVIRFKCTFPAHDLAVSTNPEDYDDQFVFNRIVRQLFLVLARLPIRQEPFVTLVFRISTPREYARHSRGYEDHYVSLGQIRLKYLELLSDWDTDLPNLASISCFDVEFSSRSLLFSPSSINLIASKMNRLKRIKWVLSDGEKMDLSIRARQRTMFADTLEKIPDSLEDFSLDFERQPPTNNLYQAPSIIPANAPSDILSRAFYRFTQREKLKCFFLEASVDLSTLCPLNFQSPTENPCWPNLKSLTIRLNAVLPSGQWIHNLDPDIELSDSDAYMSDGEVPGDEYERHIPLIYDPAVLNEIALALARCASRMPNIEVLDVACQDITRMGVIFFKDSYKWKEPCLEIVGEGKLPQLSDEVLDAWQEAVKTHGLEWGIHLSDFSDDLFHWS